MSESESEEINDLSNPDVTTKYRAASDIVQKALLAVVEACVEGAVIGDICAMGDKIMEEDTGKQFNKKVKGKKMEKGVAFPTCISCNELVGHFCPWSEVTPAVLKAGDVAKIELGCHFDGFITQGAHTVIVGAEPVTDRRADVVMAAWNAAEAAVRLMQVGNKNTQVTEAFGKIAAEFNCKPVLGVMSHQVKKHVIDGQRAIHSVYQPEDKPEVFEFEMNEVYCIDVVMSTSEGKPKESEVRSTVFKRAVEKNYSLRAPKARQFMSEVQKRFPTLPFTLRAIEDIQVARVGLIEAKRHELLEEYPVLREKDGQFVAKFQFTVLLLPGGTKKITGLPLGNLETQVKSSLEVKDEDMKTLLASPAAPKPKKKAKAKKESTEGDSAKDAAAKDVKDDK